MDLKHMFMSSILKLSACGFGIRSDNVTKVAIIVSKSNGTQQNFLAYNIMVEFDWLKLSESATQLL
jgi:hypothetical protein